jgi:Sulfotransferase domain
MALKVIGAGLGRTGTLSLKLALEQLGFGPCYHMQEVFAEDARHLSLWLDVVRGSPDWDAIFEGYQATTDYPCCTYWRELAELFPEAKIILSTRNPDSWFDSASETIFSRTMLNEIMVGPAAEFVAGAVTGVFGDRISERDYMTNWFRNWENGVTSSVPPERLLVYEARQGWEPLCAFLGVPVPVLPYPRANSKADIQATMAQRLEAGNGLRQV